MKRLETPPTLRTPTLDEIPNTEDLVKAIKRSQTANIVEGFVLKYNTEHDLPFKFYCEININNPRIWNLFKTLALHLPTQISFIFNHADGEAIFGKYRDKYITINKLSNFITELTQDCFLEFGVIHHTDDFLEEVFVDCTKYIKYWGMNESWFRMIMKEYNISEVPGLNFMDEFPKVRESLGLHFDNIVETKDLIDLFKIEFT